MLSRRSFYCLAMLMALPAIMSAVGDSKRPEIKPMIPTADRSSGSRVFLEHADLLHKQTSGVHKRSDDDALRQRPLFYRLRVA